MTVKISKEGTTVILPSPPTNAQMQRLLADRLLTTFRRTIQGGS